MLSVFKSNRKDPRHEAHVAGVCFISDNGTVCGIADDISSDALFFAIAKKCVAFLPDDSGKLLVQFQGDTKEFLCTVIRRSADGMALNYYGEEAYDFFQSLLAKGRSCFDCGGREHLRQCPKCSGVNTLCAKCLKMGNMCRDCRSLELMYRSKHQGKQKKQRKRQVTQNTVEITQTRAWKTIRKVMLS